jgi:hypothetical protein
VRRCVMVETVLAYDLSKTRAICDAFEAGENRAELRRQRAGFPFRGQEITFSPSG